MATISKNIPWFISSKPGIFFCSSWSKTETLYTYFVEGSSSEVISPVMGISGISIVSIVLVWKLGGKDDDGDDDSKWSTRSKSDRFEKFALYITMNKMDSQTIFKQIGDLAKPLPIKLIQSLLLTSLVTKSFYHMVSFVSKGSIKF